MNSSSPSFVLHSYLYSQGAVSQAIDAFSGCCAVTCSTMDDAICVTIIPASDAPPMIAEEFLNYALNLSAEQILSGV